MLLDHGAGPNAVGIYGNTAPHCAVTGENTAIVAKLLSHKANTEANTRMTSDHFTNSEGKQRANGGIFIK